VSIDGTFVGETVSGYIDTANYPCQFGCSCCYNYNISYNAHLPMPEVSINDVAVTEGDSGTTAAVFDVTLDTTSGDTITVDWTTTDGTADSSDYAPDSGMVTFNPGQTSKTVSVNVYGDTDEESNETFYVDLSNVTNAAIGDDRGVGTINDDDTVPMTTLYDQTDSQSTFGGTTQNFEPANDTYDCESADDFNVATGGWQIEQVQILGFYSDSGGPLDSMNVWFYKDQAGYPAATATCTHTNVVPTSNGASSSAGTIVIDLPSPCILGSGTHWVAVQANQDFGTAGQFYWLKRTAQTLEESVWRNPGDGFGTGFTDWTKSSDIDPSYDPDRIFLLMGRAAPPLFADGFESGNTSAWSSTVGGS
jgi:hypothetical protein